MVEFIAYKGSIYPIRISYFALKNFQKETGKEIDQVDADMSLLEVLLWFSLVAGHKAQDKTLELKREEVEFILDESMNEFIEKMSLFFPSGDSTGVKKKKS